MRELKSGGELGNYEVGVKRQALTRMDEAREETVVIVVKKEQLAISKADIKRIDPGRRKMSAGEGEDQDRGGTYGS